MSFNILSYLNEKGVSHSKMTPKKFASVRWMFTKVALIQSHVIILPLLIMNLMSND
jgi:hypothetical protein